MRKRKNWKQRERESGEMLKFRVLDGAVANSGFVVSGEGGKGDGGDVRLKKTKEF